MGSFATGAIVQASAMALVEPYDPDWPKRFQAEAVGLRPLFQSLHHIGSTAVPGLAAKATIDILGVSIHRDARDAILPALAGLGYDLRGENGIPGRLFLRKMAGDVRLVHLHAYVLGSRHITRHLAFRGWLRAHPDGAAEYGAHKLALAARPGKTRADYVADKDTMVRRLEALAVRWYRQG
ncbi:MAG: GrpB family protein [Pseudomonadota bacterium]